MNQPQQDCVIVGGGIGGAVLALALARKGKHVTITEKELRPPTTSRPEILASATIRTFHQLGIDQRLLEEAAIPLKGLHVWDSESKELILEFNEEDFTRVQVQPYSTDPSKTRQLLIEAAEKFPSAALRRGIEIKQLLFEDGRIVGVEGICGNETIQFRSQLVVGDDGTHSKIRSSLGINLRLKDFPLVFLAAGGNLLPGQSNQIGQVWLNPKNIKEGLLGGVFMPQPGRRSAFVFLLTPKTYERFSSASPKEFYAAAQALSPLCYELGKQYQFPKDFHLFKRPFGHSGKYVSDGVALIGDAAHPVTPVGGQGANMSVADAISLAKNIEALDSYERQRHSANERSVNFSRYADLIFRFFLLFPFLSGIMTKFIRFVNHNHKLKFGSIRLVSQAFLSRQN